MRFPKVTELKVINLYAVFLRYEDGISGEVDLSEMAGKGVFKWWDKGDNFTKVSIDKETGAVVWNDKIDLDPDALYLKLRNLSFDEWKSMQSYHAPTI